MIWHVQEIPISQTDSDDEHALLYPPNTNRALHFLRNIFDKIHFFPTHPHYFSGHICNILSLFFFMFVSLQRKALKNAIFCSKTSFLTSWHFCKITIWHPYTLSEILNIPRNAIKLGKKAKQSWTRYWLLTWTNHWPIKPQILDQSHWLSNI